MFTAYKSFNKSIGLTVLFQKWKIPTQNQQGTMASATNGKFYLQNPIQSERSQDVMSLWDSTLLLVGISIKCVSKDKQLESFIWVGFALGGPFSRVIQLGTLSCFHGKSCGEVWTSLMSTQFSGWKSTWSRKKGLIQKRQRTSCALASHVKIKSQRYSIKAGDFWACLKYFHEIATNRKINRIWVSYVKLLHSKAMGTEKLQVFVSKHEGSR